MNGQYLITYDASTGEISGCELTFQENRGLNDNQLAADRSKVESRGVDNICSELYVDTETEELRTKEDQQFDSVSSAKQQKIEEIKQSARDVLERTDWYIVREQETGKAVPQDVLDHRAEVRAKSNSLEDEVEGLSSMLEVLDFSYTLPEPPAD